MLLPFQLYLSTPAAQTLHCALLLMISLLAVTRKRACCRRRWGCGWGWPLRTRPPATSRFSVMLPLSSRRSPPGRMEPPAFSQGFGARPIDVLLFHETVHDVPARPNPVLLWCSALASLDGDPGFATLPNSATLPCIESTLPTAATSLWAITVRLPLPLPAMAFTSESLQRMTCRRHLQGAVG